MRIRTHSVPGRTHLCASTVLHARNVQNWSTHRSCRPWTARMFNTVHHRTVDARRSAAVHQLSAHRGRKFNTGGERGFPPTG